jgi:hypothetical protein
MARRFLDGHAPYLVILIGLLMILGGGLLRRDETSNPWLWIMLAGEVLIISGGEWAAWINPVPTRIGRGGF